MSTCALLVCHANRTWLSLGKPLFGKVGPVRTFSYHSTEFSDAEFARALWTFLDRCAVDDLALHADWEVDSAVHGIDFDDLAEGYTQVGGWTWDGDVPMEAYLADVPVEPTTYAAPRRPGSGPGGLVRRRAGPGAVDETFTHDLRWETTDVLRPPGAGSGHVEISEGEAADVALAVVAARLRPDWPDRRSRVSRSTGP